MADDRKIVFVQCEDEDNRKLADVLSALNSNRYFFFIVPKSFTAFSRNEVKEMIKQVLQK